MKSQSVYKYTISIVTLLVIGCAPGIKPGPDKEGLGMLGGAMTGAGAGAVTGFQVSAASGPGAAIGAGFGGVAGAISGALTDANEEQLLKLKADLAEEEKKARVHQVLAHEMERRIRMHPTREIYPADIFFVGDDVVLCDLGIAIVEQLARSLKERKPWSRIVVVSYEKAVNPESSYAIYLTEKRARAIGDELTRQGIEPRRIVTRPVIVDQPVLIDPEDKRDRFNQAIEIILVDK